MSDEYKSVYISVENVGIKEDLYTFTIIARKKEGEPSYIFHSGKKEKILRKFEAFIFIFTERTKKIELFGLAEEFLDKVIKIN